MTREPQGKTTMTREQQISAAVKQLDGRGHKEVETALVEIEFFDILHKQRTDRQVKNFKPALRSLLKALRKAQQARAKLPWDIATFEFVELKNYEKQVEQLLDATPPIQPKRDEFRKHVAARIAHDLLRRLRRHGRLGYKPTLTINGPWRKLSAILYGKPSSDFLRICRNVKSSRAKSDTNRLGK